MHGEFRLADATGTGQRHDRGRVRLGCRQQVAETADMRLPAGEGRDAQRQLRRYDGLARRPPYRVGLH